MYARRRGLGALVPCSSLSLPPGFVGPVECDPSSGPALYPASQSQLANLQDQLNGLIPYSQSDPGMSVSGGGTVADWLNRNAGMLAWVGGGLLALMLVKKAVR